MVPALEQIIKRGGALGVKDIVLGMPHRGRLNVLAAVMGKPYRVIFHEFQGGSSLPSDIEGSGDVKYHLGASSDRAFDGNKVHLSLTANPQPPGDRQSGGAGQGARQAGLSSARTPDRAAATCMPLLMHGDAAFAGQGVVAECFALMGLKGYRTGGTIHFIVNNQIGFTTSPRYSPLLALSVRRRADGRGADLPRQRRRSRGGDLRRQGRHRVPPAVRQGRGHRHVLLPPVRPQRGRRPDHHPAVDVHDDQGPSVDARTLRPAAGRRGRGHRRPRSTAGSPSSRPFLDAEFEAGKTYQADKADWLDGKWAGLGLRRRRGARAATPPCRSQKLRDLGLKLTAIPERLRRAQDGAAGDRAPPRGDRDRARASTGRPAEHLAFATPARRGLPGAPVRPGQRARHLRPAPFATSIDQTTEERYTPLNNIRARPGRTSRCIDSALSEEAVLGFEYGFSLADPNTLTTLGGPVRRLRQRRPGGRSTSSSRRASASGCACRGLVMLLPHGYEGQGPEHSSARLERYLQLCAEDNLQVANCSTPANYFHILRRQMHARVPQAADPDDAQVAAAAQEGGLEPGRHGRGLVLPPRAVRRRRARRRTTDVKL